MHRTPLLLPPDLHRRAAQAAKARRMSLGHLVREALGDYLARAGGAQPSADAIDKVLLAEPFDDPDPDPEPVPERRPLSLRSSPAVSTAPMSARRAVFVDARAAR